jgi:Uma2 family endonuclease
MANTTTHLMTVAEYEQIPERNEGFYYELHHGELVKVCFPKTRHYKTQWRLYELLAGVTGSAGFVGIEIAFRPLPEHEVWGADVAFVSKERWQRIDPDGYLLGSPELVIEVLSPSNTADEIQDKEKTCLEGGCREFWVVNEKRRQVKVTTPDGVTKTYHEGQQIPLTLFGAGSLAVSAIFTE